MKTLLLPKHHTISSRLLFSMHFLGKETDSLSEWSKTSSFKSKTIFN